MKRIYFMIETCEDCGELLDDCSCDFEEEEDLVKNFKFEHAFESITENNSQFRKINPKYD